MILASAGAATVLPTPAILPSWIQTDPLSIVPWVTVMTIALVMTRSRAGAVADCATVVTGAASSDVAAARAVRRRSGEGIDGSFMPVGPARPGNGACRLISGLEFIVVEIILERLAGQAACGKTLGIGQPEQDHGLRRNGLAEQVGADDVQPVAIRMLAADRVGPFAPHEIEDGNPADDIGLGVAARHRAIGDVAGERRAESVEIRGQTPEERLVGIEAPGVEGGGVVAHVRIDRIANALFSARGLLPPEQRGRSERPLFLTHIDDELDRPARPVAARLAAPRHVD